MSDIKKVLEKAVSFVTKTKTGTISKGTKIATRPLVDSNYTVITNLTR